MIKECKYKDQKAICLESGSARFLFLPDTGANLASASLTKTNREFLIQRPEDKYRRVPFDGLYTDAECCGMDDMFPTIDVCRCEQHPWEGVLLTDHGEVWNLPMKTELTDEYASFSTHGVRLPYTFKKTVSLNGECAVNIDYEIENMTAFPFDYLWAAHTMLRAEPGTRIETPDGTDEIQVVFSTNGRIGEYGDAVVYPVATDKDGVTRDRSVMSAPERYNEKYYFKNALKEGRCAAHFPDGHSFTMEFDADKVPYLGILQNFGDFRDMYNLFLEPCSASFDRPDIARAMKKLSSLQGYEKKAWRLTIRLG